MPGRKNKKSITLNDVMDLIGSLTKEINKLTTEISGLKQSAEKISTDVNNVRLRNIETATKFNTLGGDLTELRLEINLFRDTNEALGRHLNLLEYHQ